MMFAVGGWRGVGATTAALLLATVLADEHDEAWLVEADPAGGVLTGRLDVPAHALGGLERVAFPVERASTAELFSSVSHRLGSLRVVTAPADPFRAFACHHPRAPWVQALADLGSPVVVDVGRIRAGSPVWPLLLAADVVLVVGAPEVTSAVSTAEWIDAAGRVSPADPGLPPGRARAVVVDAPGGLSFGAATLEHDLADEWGGWLPWEPATVDLVHRGATADDRRLRRSALVDAARRLALAARPAEVTR
jgi:hypothetical protein